MAVGFSLIYGVGGILNLAQGAFLVLTGFMIFWLTPYTGYPAAIVLALVIIMFLAAISYLALIKHFQEREVAVMIITFALGYFIEQFISFCEYERAGSTGSISLPEFVPNKKISFFGIVLTYQTIFAMIGAFVTIVCLLIFINKAKIGKSIRAVAQNKDAARLMGINVTKILAFTMMLSALLTGLAGALYLPVTSFSPGSGWYYLLTPFSVVILGGLGNVKGSIIGAFIISYAKQVCFWFLDITIGGAIAEIVPLAVIVLILLIAPHGLFGKKEII